MANRNWASAGKIYSMHTSPVLIDCNFVVAVSDTGGLGITSLKGPAVQAVYMHTSATPSALNPNPASGTIIVQLQDNYNRLFSVSSSIISPNSGSALKVDNAALTANVAYVITTLGDATAAEWHTLGVSAGITPAVGVVFIAASTGIAGNTRTSRVMAAAAAGSGVASIEAIGSPNASIAPNGLANQGFGAQIMLQCRDYAGALVAPADGSIISISVYLSNSSVTVAGE